MADNCTKINPCNCIGQPKPVTGGPAPKPTCPKGSACIKYQDTIIPHINAVGPCGKSGTFDISTVECDLSGCAGDVKFYLNDFDRDHFVSATLSGTTVTWVTQGAHREGKFGTIDLKACCGNEDGHTLSHLFCLTIGIKDLCACPECALCDKCDPCTGLCIENDVNLVAGTGTPSN